MNKMIMHYCGGAGINVSREINNSLSSLGSGFCNIVPHYIDTSTNNLGDLPTDNFWRINSNGFSGEAIDGSGGERRTNSVAIVNDIKRYLDEHKYTSQVSGEFHVVVFSGSGGSGSVTAPTLISNLRTRNVPVLGIMIGDSGNGLSCKNTMNTIATLDYMAKEAIRKPITLIYYNNNSSEGSGVGARERSVNNKIFNSLTVLSLFLSGHNEDIDTKDMINFLAPDNYETITIEPSLYCINIHVKDEIDNNRNHINLIGRTLSSVEEDTSLDLTLLQHKYGKITEANAVDTASGFTPVHMVLAGNCLVEEHELLKNTVDEYANIMDSITTKSLSGTGTADDSGMIF